MCLNIFGIKSLTFFFSGLLEHVSQALQVVKPTQIMWVHTQERSKHTLPLTQTQSAAETFVTMAAGHSWSGVFLLMYFGKHVLMWHEQDFCVSLPALWLTADQGFQLLPPAWDTIYWLIRSAEGHYMARVKECEREIPTSLGHKNIERATGHFCCLLEQSQTDRKNPLNWSGHWWEESFINILITI